MIKIISISNCHLWDGFEISLKDFGNLQILLKQSKFAHSIKYEVNGIVYLTRAM